MDIPRQLHALMNQYGSPTQERNPQFIGLIKDIFVDNPREMNLLTLGLEEGLPEKLTLAKDRVPYEMISGEMIDHLVASRGMDKKAAEWTVHTWASAIEYPKSLVRPAGAKDRSEYPIIPPEPNQKVTETSEHGDTTIKKVPPRSPGKDKSTKSIVGIGIIVIGIIIALFFVSQVFPLTSSNATSSSSPATNTSAYWYNYGMGKIDEEKYSEAINAFDHELATHPQNAKTFAYKGYALLQSGRTHEALSNEEKAITIDPRLPEAWSFKALTLDSLGNYQEALSASKRALEIDPDSGEAWIINGDILTRMSSWREAVKSYSTAYHLSSPDPRSLGLRKTVISNMFSTSEKRSITGKDYQNFTANSCEECELACALDPMCKGFTYTELPTSEKYCHLKNMIAKKVQDLYSTSGIIREKA